MNLDCGVLEMISLNKNNKFAKDSIGTLILRFLLTIFVSIGIAIMVQQSWGNNINLYHTFLETACIFIALSIFTSIWYTYGKGDDINHTLGFGYLIVAIFDALHAYYHLKLDLTAISYFDLSTRFWILGRLAEAVTLLMTVTSIKIHASKYINILISLALSMGIVYFMVAHHNALPLLLTAQGVTPTKVFLEYVVIAIYIISLFSMRGKLHSRGKITYKYILISILLSISAEICFTQYIFISNITWTLGHILKILSYLYLYKGTFISTVIFPYDELILEHKSLEAVNTELNKMSNAMKDLLDALPIGVQKFDSKGKLKYTNRKFEELLQCERMEIEDLTLHEVTNKFLAASIDKETLESHLQKSEAPTIVRTFRTLKGEALRLSVKTQSITNGVLVMVNDTKKEQELQNLNIQTETILNSINNGVMVIDSNKRIVLVNKVFEDIYEVDKNQLLDMDIDHLNKITCFETKQLLDKVINESLSGQVFDVTLTSFKGNLKELDIYVSPINNVEGDIIGAICIGTDVTEYKKEQQRMVQQEKLALLGQMGAGIVHETRNFLTTIKGRCQLIDMLTDDESIKKHSAKINSDVDEVNRIMSEFLFLSKPRETELIEVSIKDVFESVKGMIETSSLVKGVNLEIYLCDDERYMRCDESQIKQVILNICKNGIDAMAEQPNAKIIVETGFFDESNEIFIVIKDNGKGISEEDLDKIGTPFFTTKRTGTGLGLSVCYKIIKDHGGRIDVQSKLGQGTTFTIVLPCIADEEAEYE
jgi:PAS domain S-box-containing protein